MDNVIVTDNQMLLQSEILGMSRHFFSHVTSFSRQFDYTGFIASTSSWNHQQLRFATKKAGGTVKNGRDSIGKRLGLKKSGGQKVQPGNIIIRQRGLSYGQGKNTGLGRDYTIYALTEGYVKFTWDKVKRRNDVSIEPEYPYRRPAASSKPTENSSTSSTPSIKM